MSVSHTHTSRRAGTAGLLALPQPRYAEQTADTRRRLRRILVATDGTPASRGALAVAGRLARRDGAAVHVVSVLNRWGSPPPAYEFLDVTAELIAHRLSRVLPHAATAFGGRRGWTLSIIDGRVASSIGHEAATQGYELIVVGLRRRWVDRVFRRPTALALAHYSAVPVLAVPPTVRTLPARAVVGIDGGNASIGAALTAAALLDLPATIHLVHMARAPEPVARDAADGWEVHAAGPTALLDTIVRELDGSEGIASKHAVVQGDEPASRLLAYAGEVGADLIALGSHRPASLSGRVIGGVSPRMLRSASCCVLLSGLPAAPPVA